MYPAEVKCTLHSVFWEYTLFSYEVHSENKFFGLAKCTRKLYFEILLKPLREGEEKEL